MRPTSIRPGKGFWGRSYDELSRYARIVYHSEGIKGPSGPYVLQHFNEPGKLEDLKLMSDADTGGFSKAALEYVEPPPLPEGVVADPEKYMTDGYIRFSGTIDLRLPENRPSVVRSGYAAFRTADRKLTVFGRPVWDVDSYGYLALRVRSDDRSYMINVQTDSLVAPTDIHQHRLFARRPHEWETVVVPWSGFVRTSFGIAVEPQTELIKQRVKSIGLGLTDRVPGPFELCIAKMWATTNPDETLAIGPQEFRDAEDRADAESAADRVHRAHVAADAAAVSTSVPASTPLDSPAWKAPPRTATPESERLRGKDGRPVKW